VKSLGESHELLKQELENANESLVTLRKEIEELQVNSELKCEEFKKALGTEKKMIMTG
jgi:hypothetical protein